MIIRFQRSFVCPLEAGALSAFGLIGYLAFIKGFLGPCYRPFQRQERLKSCSPYEVCLMQAIQIPLFSHSNVEILSLRERPDKSDFLRGIQS